MDNVLIAIDSSKSNFWMVNYAMGLTRRVNARVSILMVVDDEAMQFADDADEWIGLPEKRLESLIAEEHSNQTHIDYYTVRGSFGDEVLNFIKENSISMLFVGQPTGNDARATRRLLDILESISTSTTCHIEVVQRVAARSSR